MFKYNNIHSTIKSGSSKESINISKQTKNSYGDVGERNTTGSLFKAVQDRTFYKPPFGFPRTDNPAMLQTLGKIPYADAVTNRISEFVASCEWNIKLKDETEKWTPELEQTRDKYIDFLNNPNDAKAGWIDIVKPIVRDMMDINTGYWNLVFNAKGEPQQIIPINGANVLWNPTIHGVFTGKSDIIFPDNTLIFGKPTDDFSGESMQAQYNSAYADVAAYYQYSVVGAVMPIPFGKNEIICFQKNVDPDDIYGRSIIHKATDLLLNLRYGSLYNLDFFLNNNMPEGVLQLLNADPGECKVVQDKMQTFATTKDALGFERKVGFKFPVVNVETKFVPFNVNPKDMDVVDQQKWFTRIMWSQMGVSSEDMGIYEDSNKSTSDTADRNFVKKAANPFLRIIQTRLNAEITPYYDPRLQFTFNTYDLDEDIKKHTLFQSQITMGIKTAEMIAEEENIDLQKLEASKQKQLEQQQALVDASGEKEDVKNDSKDNPKGMDKSKDKDDPKKAKVKGKVKDIFDNTDLEEDLLKQLDNNLNKLLKKIK